MSTTGLITASALALVIFSGGGSAYGATHSDFTKSYPLQTLKTFAFKPQHRISRDPLANNEIWASDVRDAIRNDLSDHGIVEAANAHPDFYVAFYVGLKERYDVNDKRTRGTEDQKFRRKNPPDLLIFC